MKKKILVLGCNYNQVPYINELRKRYFIIGCDKNNDAPGKNFVDIFYTCAYDNLEKLKKICKSNNDIEEIFSASSQFSIIGVSYCKKILKKKPLKDSVCQIILDKKKFYQYLKKKNINFPKTFIIKNKKDLEIRKKSELNFFLKSDHSKNPNYIYSGKIKNFIENVNWIKDRYYKRYYVLQEEIIGKNIRVNVINNRLVYFDFFNLKRIYKKNLRNIHIKKLEEDLLYICENLNIKNYIPKFDIILNKKNYFLLDIGIDPPFRLKKFFEKNKKDFHKFYIKHVLKKDEK